MIIFQEAEVLKNYLEGKRRHGQTVGFVPTMGALHEGHLALVNRSLAENDCTVVSIFVNPTQFNDPADFAKYPISTDRDIELLETGGCDILFLPSVAEIYPEGLVATSNYGLGDLEKLWEGFYRPGHFQGVCQVMDQLLQLVLPDHLYMGLKDYQQCMVVKRLLQLTGLGDRVELVPCPTLREADGLAMSSRNRRLTATARAMAPAIYSCLQEIKSELKPGPTHELMEQYRQRLVVKGFRLDYLALVDASTLKEVEIWNGEQLLVLLVAAFCEDVRLIDNLLC